MSSGFSSNTDSVLNVGTWKMSMTFISGLCCRRAWTWHVVRRTGSSFFVTIEIGDLFSRLTPAGVFCTLARIRPCCSTWLKRHRKRNFFLTIQNRQLTDHSNMRHEVNTISALSAVTTLLKANALKIACYYKAKEKKCCFFMCHMYKKFGICLIFPGSVSDFILNKSINQYWVDKVTSVIDRQITDRQKDRQTEVIMICQHSSAGSTQCRFYSPSHCMQLYGHVSTLTLVDCSSDSKHPRLK